MSYIRIEEEFGEVSESLGAFKARLDELAVLIGATDATAFVTIELEGGCYGDPDTLIAKIWRDETGQEYVARMAIEKAARAKQQADEAARRIDAERSTYERLKAKYG